MSIPGYCIWVPGDTSGRNSWCEQTLIWTSLPAHSLHYIKHITMKSWWSWKLVINFSVSYRILPIHSLPIGNDLEYIYCLDIQFWYCRNISYICYMLLPLQTWHLWRINMNYHTFLLNIAYSSDYQYVQVNRHPLWMEKTQVTTIPGTRIKDNQIPPLSRTLFQISSVIYRRLVFLSRRQDIGGCSIGSNIMETQE